MTYDQLLNTAIVREIDIPAAIDALEIARQQLDAATARRDTVICTAIEAGMSAIEVASVFGLTRQRVHQILNPKPTERPASAVNVS